MKTSKRILNVCIAATYAAEVNSKVKRSAAKTDPETHSTASRPHGFQLEVFRG